MEDRELLKRKRFLKTKICFVLAVIVFILLISKSFFSEQQWMLYHAREIRGSVMDVETDRPIENAIIVGMWALVQVPGEGSGGYAKIAVVMTDKKGKFEIPAWITFKPWKLCSVMDELAPKIIIYKPGYRLRWSHKVAREGYLDDISKTDEEKLRIKEANSINPVRLERVYSDEEIWNNFSEFGVQANFPESNYSRNQMNRILSKLEIEIALIPEENKSKQKILKNINGYRQFWMEGK